MTKNIKHKIHTLHNILAGIYNKYFFVYCKFRFPNSFISKYCSSISDNIAGQKIDRVVYCFWTGTNELSVNRRLALKSMKDFLGVNVKLITIENLSDYILPEDPLPECYPYLSDVHKSDYLRTYFMYHFGGGYSDIKFHNQSWKMSFEKLENSNAYIVGYPEVGPGGVATPNDHETCLALKKHWKLLIGNGAYICRPYTRFTEEWYQETKNRVLALSEELKAHPAKDPYGTNDDYPVKWTHILGDVFHPLCLKYHRRIIQDSNLLHMDCEYR